MKTVFSVAACCALLLFGTTVKAGDEHASQQMPKVSTPSDAAVLHAKVVEAAIIEAGKTEIVKFQLLDAKNQPVSEKELDIVHTKAVHMLVVDPGLEDYHHVHPVEGNNPGEFTASFKPRFATDYGVWLDIKLKNGSRQYIKLKLKGSKQSYVTASGQESLKQVVNGYTFKLSFDATTLKVRNPVMGTIHVTDPYAKPYMDLEPVLGAFAHVVGFYDDFKTIAHMHPLGVEPKSETAHSGPKILFHFVPQKSGFVKLFAQFKIKGEDVFVPFAVTVER